MGRFGACDGGCGEQKLELVPAAMEAQAREALQACQDGAQIQRTAVRR